MADEVQLTRDQLAALAAKLDTLDLTDDEAAVMRAVLAASAPDAEVSGYQGPAPLSQGFMNVFQPGSRVRFGESESIIAVLLG